MAASDSHKHSSLCYLLVEGGTKVSRALLLKRINDLRPHDHDPETWTLDSFLEANKTKILDSELGRQKEYILFPRSRRRHHEHWDLSIFCFILLETCALEPVLRMNLERLRKSRNKILHLDTTAISDTKYQYHLIKLQEILSNCSAYVGDDQLREEINAIIEKATGGSISESDLSKVMQMRVLQSQEEARQHLEKLEKFEEANSEKLDKLMGMVKNVDDKLGNTVEVPDAGVSIIVKNCSGDKVKALSNDMVKTFNEVIDRDFKEFEDLENDLKHRIKEAVYQTCVKFLSKGQNVVSAEENCVLLNIRCVSLTSLLTLFKDYIHGKLDDMLWVLEAAITSEEGYEDISLEAVMYKDEFWAILTKIVTDLDTCVAKQELHKPPSPSNGNIIHIPKPQTRISPEIKCSPPDTRPGSFEYVKQLEMTSAKVDPNKEGMSDVQYVDAVDEPPPKDDSKTVNNPTTGDPDIQHDNGTYFGVPKENRSAVEANVVKPDEYPPGIIVTAAIDFGTSYSGYAFAFRDHPYRIHASTWYLKANLEAAKAPTAALFDPNGSFIAFGWEAEERYSELSKDKNQHGWYFFHNFKMELYQNKKLSRGMVLTDIEGKAMPAMTVFSAVILFLKERLLKEICRTLSYLEESDISWVLTVPAIWSDAGKQFMRESAIKAGIPEKQLSLVLEPEAASLYCQIGQFQEEGNGSDIKMFPVGLRYIIADLGGGTTDIATHEVLSGGSLREIWRPAGGSFGGDRVNAAFQIFLEDLVGKKVLDYFQLVANSDYLEFMREFEMMKRRVSADASDTNPLTCPTTFFECLAEIRKKTLDECIQQERLSNLIEVKEDQMKISPELVKIFFNESIKDILIRLKEIIRSVENVEKVFLVGGFSASPYVREKLRMELSREFQGIDISQPVESNLHVLKGAVLTCLKPNYITERVSRYTYGFRVAEPFDENKHPIMLKDTRASGEEYCSDIFLKFIEVGQIMKFRDKVKFEFGGNRRHKQSKQESCSTEVYRSPLPSPNFCTRDEKCERIGRIIHTPPKEGWGDVLNFTTEIEIGDTEFHVTVVDNDTSKTYSKTIEFLDE